MQDDLFRRIVDYAEKYFISVFLSGGEPTDHLDELLQHIEDKKDTLFLLQTNGENFNTTNVANISATGNIYPILSIDGIGEVHDAQRNPRSFTRISEGIDLLRESKVPFGVSTVATQYNIEQLLDGTIAEFTEQIGACTWEIIRYFPIGHSVKIYERLLIDREQRKELVRYKQGIRKQGHYGFVLISPDSESPSCKGLITVFIGGELSYCPFSAWPIAKILPDDSDEEITSKIQSRYADWIALGNRTEGHCPMHKNTAGFLDFFSNHRQPMFLPTGMLDTNSPVHKKYLFVTGQRIRE